MAGIVVDHAVGQRRHRRRRQHAPRLHRRHRGQLARPRAPGRRRRHPAAGGARARRLVHERGPRRSRRAPGRARAVAGAASRAALLGRRRGGRERAAPREEPHEEVRVRVVLGRLPRQDPRRPQLDGLHRTRRGSARWRPALTSCPTPTATAVPSDRRIRRAASACVDVGRKQLKMAGAGAVAAFIVEPMQGTAGQRRSARRLPARGRARSRRSSTRSSSPTR